MFKKIKKATFDFNNNISAKVLKMNFSKVLTFSVAVGLTVSVLLSMVAFSGNCDGIRERVLRLHIVANSDSEADQNLKLQVRDRLIADGSLLLEGANDERQAEEIASKKLYFLEKAARDEIAKQGFDYPVSVTLGDAWFGTREYEETSLPAGKYKALKVVIGNGKGHNWWCVMFPPMCLPCADEEEELDDVLTDSQLDVTENQPKYKVKFKITEYYDALVQKLDEWF